MIQIDLPTLVKRLNLFSRQALEMAASECMSQQAAEITVSHVLIQMLAMPRSDLRVITRQGDIGMEELRQALTVENYTTARSADSYPAFSPMLVEWLKEGWLLASAEMQHSELRGGVLLLALLHSPLRYIPPAAAQLLTGINRDRLQQDFVQWTQESAESVVPDADCKGAGALTDVADSLLARYAKNMTEDARNDRLDPVLCRDHEIDLMIDILCRRRKNNPVVVGEAGVGKSALIEGLALRIVAGQVPDKLKNTDIMTLDLGALQAGASVKGEFEKRFKGLMAEVISSPVPVILFIDEAHTLIGAGNQQGGLDISNLLKPALARGELKTIAATTWSEYKKYFEKDAALSRRFQLVKVSEPNAAEATIILRGLSAVYEQSHGVLIDDDALQAAATLSERYLSGRQLPDKAIDVLDTACARVAINLSSPPKQISALTTLSHQQEAEIRQLERELRIGLRTNTSRMTEVLVQYDETLTALDELEAAWHQQQTLVQEIIALRQQLLGMAEDDAASLPHVDAVEDTPPESEQDNTGAKLADEAGSEQPEETAETVSPVQRLAQLTAELDALHNDRLLVSPHVDKKQIAAVIAEWTGVPLNRLSQNEMSVITDLPVWLGDTIKGQDLAIASLHKHLLTARADLRRPGRPLGAFLLAGPSGVGKTETVLQLAELLYGGRQYLTTINMSEFQEKHTVSRLIGSPPGYVGYGEGGVLTEAIRQKPYSVVLLDEVEKAHPDVLNLFYQAFDKGEMADGEGRLIDCKNIVFFLTSNLGYQVIVEHADDPETMQEVLYPVLADFFKPALLARMEVVPYQSLKTRALGVLPADLNLRDQVGPTFDQVFTSADDNKLVVPQFLTRYGLQSYFVKQRDELVELTAMDSWVLNLTRSVKYSDADRAEIQRQLTEQYISDYTATWRAGMDNLNIRNFESIGQLTGALEQVISGDLPLQRALTVLRDNTQPGVFSEKLSAKEREEALAEPDYQLLTRLGHEFAPENSTLAVQKDKESTMQAVYQQLTELHRYLLAIQNAPVPGKSALKAVQLRLDQNSSDPIFATRQMAKTLPAPLNRWVGRLADQAWHVVMVEAVHYMEVDWRDSVVKPFNEQLANNYPFNPRSAQDASLDAFERFFKPDGILDTFYQQNLKLFIDNDLSLEDGDNSVIIREDIIAQLKTAQKIRDIFFSKQNGLGTSFAVETVSLSGNKRRSVLNLDGQLVDYSQGRNYTAHLVWPNNMREGNESKLTLVGANGGAPRSISFSGPWAQFRLFGAGQLTGVQDGNFTVRFSVDGGAMTYRVHIRCSSNCYRLTTPLRAQQRCGWPHLNSKTMSAGCNNFLIPPRYSRWKPGCR
ncbi:TPA: type VI secretion system ATPase TssH [Escherichia coli]|nr:type VI secretion system ATPase TssH [Escherichia coli]HBN0501614.1 type VI secretion system ATPase TssH [Escherichia coli]HBN0672057.1 type VI secretion system ATPase TssH [Escherichia coli]HCC6500160.1 type VI secretion system ATPase TssH [Escherichia coli]